MFKFRFTAAGPPVRSCFCRILAICVTFVTSGCALIAPANYIAKPHMQESRTRVCYRHASRLVTRCDRVEYRSDEDVRGLLNSTRIPSYRALGAVR